MNDIYLHNHPKLYIKYLFRATSRVVKRWLLKLFDYTLPAIFISYLLFLAYILPGFHQYYLTQAKNILIFTLWWLTLGILSSIGLGTGLHTFVLFLGPFIASLSSASSYCGHVPNLLPSRWEFEKFEDCSPNGSISIIEILWAVQLESFLWGFGTLIGELPPYLIAKNARNKEETNTEESPKLLRFIKENIQKHAFCTLCLCASVPNPLFDLAGLMAGHFGVPFWEFFIATGIGKSVIKVQIQVFLVALMFSGNFLEDLAKAAEAKIGFLGNSLTSFIKKQKKSSFKGNESEKSILAYLWDGVIALMVLYFVISLCNTVVRKERVRASQEIEKCEKKFPISLVKFE